MRLALLIAAVLWLLPVFLLWPGEADAAKPDPWHRAPSVASEFAVVQQIVRPTLPVDAAHQSLCGGALRTVVEEQPRLPAAYSSALAGDVDLPAGTPVEGWYGRPGGAWVAGRTCVVAVKAGTPMAMCDEAAHEWMHDLGYRHGDAVATMNGETLGACRSLGMRSVEAYAAAFDAMPRGARCRAVGWLRVECRARGGVERFDFRGTI